jgi:hypothetical protein
MVDRSARWTPEPLTFVALALSLVGAVGVYLKSEALLVGGNRLNFYAVLAVPALAVVLLVAVLRRDPIGVRTFAVPLAVVGLVVSVLQAIHAWGLLDGAAPWCQGSVRCFNGIGSPFLHLSWLDWVAIAAYFATFAAAGTMRRPVVENS